MDTQTHDLGTRTSDHVDSEFTASQAHESNVAQEIVAQRMLAIPPTARARIREAPIGADAAVAVASHDPTRTAAAAARTVQVPLPMDFDRAASKRPRNPLPSFDPECASETLRTALRQKIQQIEEAEKKEAGEYREFEQEMQQRAKANMGSTAATSLEEMGPEERKFVTTLINGVKNKSTNDTTFHGIMRSHNLIGQLNCPLTHQRNVVRRIASASTTMYLVAHGMGLGKTATALMAICAEACMLGRMPKVIISVPSATLDQWQDSVADWMRIDFKRVLCTSTLSKINKSVMEEKDIFILSRDTVARAYGACFQKYEKHHQIQTGPGLRWVSQWDRIGVFEGPNAMAPLHPIFEPPQNEALGWEGYWDMMIVDEVHYCRNPDSRWCESHAELAHVATKRIGLSGTAVINRGGDLGGIAKALKAASKFQRKGAFTKNHNHKTIDRDMVREFTNEKQFHRATADILQLPPIEREAINYDVRMPLEHVAKYNSKLTDARNLKMRIERAGGKASGQDLKRLMALLQVMQQYVVSPVLGEEGAATFREQQELYDKASSNENATGAFYALRDEIKALRAQGHRRIVVAANHTTIMKIVRRWLERNNPEFGTIYVYDGELSVKGRLNVKRGFLQSDKGLLFLSVGAGGVGLHLVPGCESMIFWGSLAYSPAHVEQCLKRIHRIGQLSPITGKVTIKFLIPHGSVDGAIGKVHSDKKRLMDLCLDDNNDGFANEDDSEWRKHSRIVDEAKPLDESGSFPPMPLTQVGPTGELETFTLLPGVKTRGVPEYNKPNESVGMRGSSSLVGPPAPLSAQAASAAAAAVIAIDDSDDE